MRYHPEKDSKPYWQRLQMIIDAAFERRAEITPINVDTITRDAINQAINLFSLIRNDNNTAFFNH